MLTDDEISEILLPLMPLKDPYVFARAVESFVMARGTPVTRKKNLAVMTWREVAWEVAGDAALNEVVDARVRVTLADDLRELTEVACGIRKVDP